MDEERKNLGMFWTWMVGLLVVTLFASWGWSRLQLGNLAYMQFVTEKQQQNLARQQQLEVNEIERRRLAGECCNCSLIPEEVPNEEPSVEEESGQNP